MPAVLDGRVLKLGAVLVSVFSKSKGKGVSFRVMRRLMSLPDGAAAGPAAEAAGGGGDDEDGGNDVADDVAAA